jgi:hypothetical protein
MKELRVDAAISFRDDSLSTIDAVITLIFVTPDDPSAQNSLSEA